MIRADRSTTTTLELEFPSGTLTVPYSTFMGQQPDMSDPVVAQQVADAVRDWIYTQRDETIKVNRLPTDDPAKTTDPATEGSFWRGSGGQKVLVTRELIIFVAWDGERFQYGLRLPR